MLDDQHSRYNYRGKKREKMEQLDKYGFDHPTNTIVSGPSGSGKSQILGHILGCAEYIFDPAPVKKILFYREEPSSLLRLCFQISEPSVRPSLAFLSVCGLSTLIHTIDRRDFVLLCRREFF